MANNASVYATESVDGARASMCAIAVAIENARDFVKVMVSLRNDKRIASAGQKPLVQQ